MNRMQFLKGVHLSDLSGAHAVGSVVAGQNYDFIVCNEMPPVGK